jgi:hypothetical protein
VLLLRMHPEAVFFHPKILLVIFDDPSHTTIFQGIRWPFRAFGFKHPSIKAP